MTEQCKAGEKLLNVVQLVLVGKVLEPEFEECLLRLILEEGNARQRRKF